MNGSEETLDYDDLFSNELSFSDLDNAQGCLHPLDNTNPNPMEEQDADALSPLPSSVNIPNLIEATPVTDQMPAKRSGPQAHISSVPTPVVQKQMQIKQLPSPGTESKKGKKRGSYNCGKCGQPKKGHTCVDKPGTSPLKDLSPYNTPQSHSHSRSGSAQMNVEGGSSCYSHVKDDNVIPQESSQGFHTPQTSSVYGTQRNFSGVRHCNFNANKVAKVGRPRGSSSSSLTSSYSSNDRHGRGALAGGADMDSVDSVSFADQVGSTRLPAICVVEVLKQLPPPSLLAASNVCRQWRQCALYVWAAVRETRLLVAPHGKVYIPRVLQKCYNLMHLTLDVRSEIDDTLLSSIAALRPCLVSLEIHVSEGGVSKVTRDGLNHFVAECKSLSSLKLEGCNDIGSLNIVSTSLSTLWLADCCSIESTVINCMSLTELSLDFVPQEDDSTDLCNVIEDLGQSSPKLLKLHVASACLNHTVVSALARANFRFLRMLSLTFGSEITDNSVTAISSSCYNLELLDLSGSSITDRGLGIICNAFLRTLTKLLIALCPHISVAGLEMVTTQLPFLQLLDCGMSICGNGSKDKNSIKVLEEAQNQQSLRAQNLNSNEKGMSDKLVIQHTRLKKLSLWGCSGIHFLYLECPNLVDLNINSCSSLNPDSVLLQCPNLKAVHAAYCDEVLVNAIQGQVNCTFQHETLQFSMKRLPDGSKRVQAPCLGVMEPHEDRQVDQKDSSVQQHLQCLVHTI